MSFFSKISDLVFGPEDDDELDFAAATVEAPYEEPVRATSSSKKPKVVSIAATTQMKVVVVSIEHFEETKEIVDHLRNKKPVVLNLEKLDKDTSRRVIDIISGASYALGGSTQKVAKGILLVAPYNVDIMADVRDEIENGVFLPWEE